MLFAASLSIDERAICYTSHWMSLVLVRWLGIHFYESKRWTKGGRFSVLLPKKRGLPSTG